MAERILLASQYHSSMLTHWTDELYCTRRKDRKYSLRERKVGDGGRHWFPGTNNIQTAQQFIDAYDGLEHVNTDGWDFQVDILPKIFLLDPLFGFSVEKELKVMDLEEETERRIGQFIALIMRNAEIQFPSGVTNMRVHKRYVEEYVLDFVRKNGKPPIGSHSVNGLPVIFSDIKIDTNTFDFLP